MKRLHGLDGIRSAACLMIVSHHLMQQLHVEFSNNLLQIIQSVCLNTLQSGVTVFFVLSGALLARPFWKNYFSNEDMPGLKDFFIRRAARIIPGFYAAVIISFLIEGLFSAGADMPIKRFLTAITFTSGLHYTTLFVSSVNGPLWSISFEVISYVLLVFFMLGLFYLSNKRRADYGITYWCMILCLVFVLNEMILFYCQTDSVQSGWEFGSIGGAKYMMPGVIMEP